MAKPQITNVLNRFTEAPADVKLKNYDKIQISFNKHNNLQQTWTSDQEYRVICTAPLTEPFKFGASPEYTTFGDIVQKLDALPGGGMMNRIRGLSEAGTMSSTRETFFGRVETAKLYKGVSPVSFNFSFMCFEDLDNMGQPITDPKKEHGWSIYPFLAFTMLSFPNMSESTMKDLNEIFESFSQGDSGIGSKLFGVASGGIGALFHQFSSAAGGAKQFFTTVFANSEGVYPSDHFASKTQNCINIRVSNLGFLPNMVIKSFNATFSREILDSGLPVYTKYTLDVEPIVQPTTQELLGMFGNDEFMAGPGRYFSKLKDMAGDKITAPMTARSIKTSENALSASTGGEAKSTKG